MENKSIINSCDFLELIENFVDGVPGGIPDKDVSNIWAIILLSHGKKYPHIVEATPKAFIEEHDYIKPCL